MRHWLSFNRNLGIQLLALYLLLIVPLTVALLVFDYLVGLRIRSDVEANDLSLARAIAQETDISLVNAMDAVQQLASYSGVIDNNPQAMGGLFSVILKTRPDVNLVYRLDANGTMSYHYPTGPGSTIGLDFSFREYYQRATHSDQPLISKGRISPTTEQPVATAVMPIWSQKHKFLGLVATNIKLESLSDTLTDVTAGQRPGESFQVVILDSSSQIIAYNDPQLLLHNVSDLLPNLHTPILSSEESSRIMDGPGGEDRLYTFAPIPRVGWGVVVSRPTSAAFATQITLHRIIIGIAISFLIIGFVFWVALTRQVILPVERLASISEAIGLNQQIGPEDQRLLTRMAGRNDQIGHLIRSILRMEESIAARIKEQETLLETSKAVVSTLDPQTVLDRILKQVERLLDVKMCAIVALDQQGGVFRVQASRGLSKRYTQQLTIQPTEPFSISMRALHSKQPIQISDTENDPSYVIQRPRSRAEGFRAVLAIPLNTQHAPPSALLVYRRDPHIFTEKEIQLLVSFANHATMAIENAVLFTRSDMRLQEQTRRLEALVQSLHDGLVLSDLNGRVIYANRRISELADLPLDGLSGTRVESILKHIISNAPEPKAVRQAVNNALSGKSDEHRAEIPLIVQGRTIYLRLQAFEVTDARGISIGRGLILHDITADRELDRMKTSLVSTVSHELRTPLAAIKGYASTLLAEDVEWDRESQREFLKIISDESDRLTSLVNNLLDLSRIEAGSLRLSRAECQIDELIKQAAKQAQAQPGSQVKVRIEPNLPVLYADPPRLETILRNLIENAVKYAGPDALIEVNVSHAKHSIVFRVEDNGPGIPTDESQRIFESFYRVDDSLTRLASGAGLGLTICQGLVWAHDGDIWVEPREKGACIAFSIPIVEISPNAEQI